MRIGLAVLMFMHGIAHLVGFAGAWQLSRQIPFKTTVLGGRIDVGQGGAKVVGLLWAVAALMFMVAAVGAWVRESWWLSWGLASSVFSLLMCILGWPDARLGLPINLVLAVFFVVLRSMQRG